MSAPENHEALVARVRSEVTALAHLIHRADLSIEDVVHRLMVFYGDHRLLLAAEVNAHRVHLPPDHPSVDALTGVVHHLHTSGDAIAGRIGGDDSG
jgi:hypothetical protein